MAEKPKVKPVLKRKPTEPAKHSGGAPVRHIKAFLEKELASYALQIMAEQIPWTRFAPAPNSRLVYGWNQGGSTEADAVMQQIITRLEETEHCTVSGVFVNYYRNGADYCPYHRDQYGLDAYTLSLGASRDFCVKADSGSVQTWRLNSGDLYFMPVAMHRTYKHSIPKRASAGPRISILFFTKAR